MPEQYEKKMLGFQWALISILALSGAVGVPELLLGPDESDNAGLQKVYDWLKTTTTPIISPVKIWALEIDLEKHQTLEGSLIRTQLLPLFSPNIPLHRRPPSKQLSPKLRPLGRSPIGELPRNFPFGPETPPPKSPQNQSRSRSPKN